MTHVLYYSVNFEVLRNGYTVEKDKLEKKISSLGIIYFFSSKISSDLMYTLPISVVYR